MKSVLDNYILLEKEERFFTYQQIDIGSTMQSDAVVKLQLQCESVHNNPYLRNVNLKINNQIVSSNTTQE